MAEWEQLQQRKREPQLLQSKMQAPRPSTRRGRRTASALSDQCRHLPGRKPEGYPPEDLRLRPRRIREVHPAQRQFPLCNLFRHRSGFGLRVDFRLPVDDFEDLGGGALAAVEGVDGGGGLADGQGTDTE